MKSFESDSKVLRAEKKRPRFRDMRRTSSKKKEKKNSDDASNKETARRLTKFQCLRFFTNSFRVGTQAAMVARASTSSTKTPVVLAETPRGRPSWSSKEGAAVVVAIVFSLSFSSPPLASFVSSCISRATTEGLPASLSAARARGAGERKGPEGRARTRARRRKKRMRSYSARKKKK